MVEAKVNIGKRTYRIAYELEQEAEFQRAVELLHEEVMALEKASPQMREAQLLMLGGIMIAHRHTAYDGERTDMRKKLRDLENEIALARAQAKAANLSGTDAEDFVQEMQAHTAQIQDEKAAMEDALALREREVNALTSELHKASSLINELEKAVLDERGKNQGELALSPSEDALQRENERLKTELDQLRGKLADASAQENYKRKYTQAQSRIKALEEELESFNRLDLADDAPKANANADGSAALVGALDEIVKGLETLAKS